MSLKSPKSWLLILGLPLLLVSTAMAQTPPYGVANDPTAFGVPDGALAAPAELSLFGRGPQQNYGYFATAEYLLWSISNPTSVHDFGVDGGSRQVYINNQNTPSMIPTSGTIITAGPVVSNQSATNVLNQQQFTLSTTVSVTNQPFSYSPPLQLTTQRNSLNTSWLTAPMTGGFRTDFGYVDEETGRGWLFNVTALSDQSQSNTSRNVAAVFEDGTNDPTLRASLYNGLNSYTATTGQTWTLVTSVNATSTTVQTTNTASFGFLSFSQANGPIPVPLLWGFVAAQPTSATAATAQWPNGYAADINGNGVYGPNGRDRGVGATTGNTTTQNDGVPDREDGGVPPLPTDYGDLVPLPLVFNVVQSKYTSHMWGTEVNRLYRFADAGPWGGRWDVFGGVRYINFADTYSVVATGGILDTTTLNVNANNNIVGPQVGFRWTKLNGRRLTLSSEGRFLGGANFQTIRQNGLVGSNLTQQIVTPLPAFTSVNVPSPIVNGVPGAANSIVYQTNQPNNPGGGIAAPRLSQPLTLQPTSFNATRNHTEFNPVYEFRAKLNYQVFERLSLSAGWTGTYIDGVARASGMTDYFLPAFRINEGRNREGVFLNGLTLGVEFNR
jgi:hypothetical protein